jgi:transposase
VAKRKKRQGGELLAGEYFNRPALAAYLDVGISTLANWASRGEGPPYFVMGGQTVYRRAAVTEWLQQIEKTAMAEAQRPRHKGRPRKKLTGKE